MSIKLTDNSQETGGIEIATGVYAKEVLIKNVENHSNHPNNPEKFYTKSGFEPEILLTVTYDTGMGFDKQLWLFGKYIADKVTGKIKGWVSRGNSVQRFLRTLFGEFAEISDDFSIPDSLIAKARGMGFTVVDYVSGWYNDKPSYDTWDKTFPLETPKEIIETEWRNSVQYIKKYNPGIIKEYREKKVLEDVSYNKDEFQGEDVV